MAIAGIIPISILFIYVDQIEPFFDDRLMVYVVFLLLAIGAAAYDICEAIKKNKETK